MNITCFTHCQTVVAVPQDFLLVGSVVATALVATSDFSEGGSMVLADLVTERAFKNK